MLWKFSFASGSTLESLFTRETPPSVEEIMDEPDILNECKAQNQRLVSFLSREQSLKSLLQWIVSGLDELNDQIRDGEEAALAKAIADPDAYPPFDPSLASSSPIKGESRDDAPEVESPPLEPAKMAEEAMRRAESERDLASKGKHEDEGETQRSRYPTVAAEILTCELWIIPETMMLYKDTLLRPFFDSLAPEETSTQDPFRASEMERAKMQYWTDEDEDRERKREVIIGLWCKVMVSLITKRTPEMIPFFQSIPNVISRLATHLNSPSIHDLILRLVSCEEAGVAGTISWLSDEGLVPLLIRRLSPHYPSNTHNTVGELLKSIVTLCAPTPFNPHGGNLQEQQGGGTSSRDNRLTREIVSESNLEILLGYMLDPIELTDADWAGTGSKHLDPFIIHPLPNIASATSSLTYISSLLVEVIRRNNSDFAEPHLFHTMRNRLMNMQMAQTEAELTRVTSRKSDTGEDENRDKMELAVKEMSEGMGIVHLGTLLNMVVSRFERLNELVLHPRSQTRTASTSQPTPLTYERLRLVELLAELLHSSSMAILNRDTDAAPIYSAEGVLGGGLAGLEALGEAIEQDGEEMPEMPGHVAMGGADEEGITPARELPVSSTTTNTSDSSSEVGSVDIDELELETPTASPATSMVLSPSTPRASARHVDEATVSVESVDEDAPPLLPTGPEDQERLTAVRDAAATTSGSTVERTDASDAPVVGSTAPPSVGSEKIPTHASRRRDNEDAAVAPGRLLKSAYITHGVIPTLMDLFFQYPDNDFLHYLVYDVVQQVLSGRLAPGLNRDLVIEMICKGDLVTRVLRSAVMGEMANADKPVRAAYMGHLNFIAEEIVKFLTRCPEDLLDIISPSIPQPAWDEYVMGSLTDTKLRESRPLAGGKPMPGMAGTSGTSGIDDSSDSDDDSDDDTGGRNKSTLGSFGTFGEPLKRTKGGDGFVDRGGADEEDDDDDRVRAYYWRGGGDRRHVDSSDEDEDDADWMKPGDDFGGFQAYRSSAAADDSDDDDAWGSFSSGTPAHNENAGETNPFGDDNFDAFDESFTPSVQARASASASGATNIKGQPLTPHDWFDREFNEAWGDDDREHDDDGSGSTRRDSRDSSDDEGAPSIVIPKMDDEDEVEHSGLEGLPSGMAAVNLGEEESGQVPSPASAPIPIPLRSKASADETEPIAPPSAVPASPTSSSSIKTASSPSRRPPPPPPPSRRRAGSGAAPPSPSVLLSANQGVGKKGASPLSQDALVEQPEVATSPQRSGSGSATLSTSPSKPIDMASARPDRQGSNSFSESEASRPSIPAISTSGLNGSALSTSPTKTSGELGSPTSPTARARRRSSSISNPPDPALKAAANEEEPLGPGVSKDTEITDEGMLKKRTEEGGEVVVPMDEVALGVDEAIAAGQ